MSARTELEGSAHSDKYFSQEKGLDFLFQEVIKAEKANLHAKKMNILSREIK